jgi:hypothetical protein
LAPKRIARHAAVAQLVGEVLDQFIVDEFQQAGAGLDQRHADIQRAENRCVFHANDTAADTCQAPRQTRNLHDLITVEHARGVERHVRRAIGTGADRDDDLVAGHRSDVAVVLRDLDRVRIKKPADAIDRLHLVAGKLMLQHIDLVVERHVQAGHQVLGGAVLLDAVGAAVETALPPARQVQHRFAGRF